MLTCRLALLSVTGNGKDIETQPSDRTCLLALARYPGNIENSTLLRSSESKHRFLPFLLNLNRGKNNTSIGYVRGRMDFILRKG